MSILDNLGSLDLKRLAQEIVQDTANDLKDEVNVNRMLTLLKEGNSPAEVAQKMGQELNVVEKLKDAAVKNVKEEFGMETTTTTTSSSTASTGSSTGDAIKNNQIRREDIKVSDMPMSGKVDRDKIQFDDE